MKLNKKSLNEKTLNSKNFNEQETNNNEDSNTPKLTHFERILRHGRNHEEWQKLLNLYDMITSHFIPQYIVELNKLNEPLTKEQLKKIEKSRIKYPHLPPLYSALSICKIMPEMYFKVPRNDIFNVGTPGPIVNLERRKWSRSLKKRKSNMAVKIVRKLINQKKVSDKIIRIYMSKLQR